MVCVKVPGAHQAVGYWGRDPRCRIEQDQTQPKIRALLQDELLAGGLKARLWQAVFYPSPELLNATIPAGLQLCSCVKAAGQQADRRCFSCHGIGVIPGYKLFGHHTFWVSSISPGLTLSGLRLNTVIKPHRLELDTTSTSGSAVTPDIFFTRDPAVNGTWDYQSNATIKDPTQSAVDVDFSTDGGATWALIATLPAANPPTGRIRFRVRITRASTQIPSPAWEIIRARFPTISENGRFGPWILALKSVSPNKQNSDMRGVLEEGSGNKFWTAPLAFFDPSIPNQASVQDTLDPLNLVRDPAFVQFLDGAGAALLTPTERWSVISVAWSDSLGYLTRQFFDARQQQAKEFTALVW